MAGTKQGGKQAAETNRAKYGEDFYAKIGSVGGRWKNPSKRAFSANRELAKRAGSIGGKVSKRLKKNETV